MTQFLPLDAVLATQRMIIDATGGNHGMMSLNGIEFAVAQPQMTFGGEDFSPTLAEKAAALGFSLINNHGFSDGNKRIGYVAMKMFLRLNAHDLVSDIDDAERVILAVAASEMEREAFTERVQAHTVPFGTGR